MKIFLLFYYVTLLWALHIVIRQHFFTFIFAVFLLNLRHAYSFSTHCRNMTSFPFFKMAAATAKYQFQLRICSCQCFQKVKVYQQTKFRPDISIGGWDITTLGFEMQTPRSNRRTDSYAEWLKWRVSKEVHFGGQDDGWRHMGTIFPKNSPKGTSLIDICPSTRTFANIKSSIPHTGQVIS